MIRWLDVLRLRLRSLFRAGDLDRDLHRELRAHIEAEIGVDGRQVRVEYDENLVGPGYFKAMGIALLRGREFTPADRAGAPRVVIITQEFVRRYFDGQDPIGRHLDLPGPGGPNARVPTEVVGVVADGKYRSLGEDREPAIYETYNQRAANDRLVHVLVRSSAPPESVSALVRDAAAGDVPGRRSQPDRSPQLRRHDCPARGRLPRRELEPRRRATRIEPAVALRND